ncbi:GNAT family N-acetyltransferase [Cryptosporangium sp. NPDC051539]|uniref:GNAT family N-acetyltransferase n=1 Tax=Cryptosporangium sp. NPDC051539 TaxID=3363962 RepID=UPI0037BB5CAE
MEPVTVATPLDRAEVVASLVAAFRDDPVLRYLFPDPERYPAQAAAFFGHLFDKRVGRNTIWTVAGGAATAIWEPPGGALPVTAPALPEETSARMHAYDTAVHDALPSGPFWYLGVLGTRPGHGGRGWARAVMGAGLDRAAADGLPAVLETSKPANVEFYRRGGWEVVATLADPLPIWIMRH